MTDFPPQSPLPPPPPPNNLTPPPGYVAYGGPGAVQGTFTKIGGLTKWLVGLLAITVAVQAISLLVQLTLRNSAGDYLDGQITSTTFDDKLGLYVVVALLAGAVGVGQLVVLIIWTFKLAKNAQVLGRQPQSFGPGATIAVNLLGSCTLGILPYFMWRELWRASDPETAPGDPGWKQNRVGGVVPAHLVLTLLGVAMSLSVSVSGALGGFGTNNADDVAKNLNDKFALVGLAGLVQLAAAIVFIMLVRQLGERHMKATREI